MRHCVHPDERFRNIGTMPSPCGSNNTFAVASGGVFQNPPTSPRRRKLHMKMEQTPLDLQLSKIMHS